MGAALDRRRFDIPFAKDSSLRVRRRHILLGKLLRHLLAQEARPHARRLLLQTASGTRDCIAISRASCLQAAGEVLEDTIQEIVREAVDIEKTFVTEALPVDSSG